jgi:hypothetical protein
MQVALQYLFHFPCEQCIGKDLTAGLVQSITPPTYPNQKGGQISDDCDNIWPKIVAENQTPPKS